MSPLGQLLLDVLDAGYTKQAWHGPNLRQSLRGVSARQAAWRPAGGRHNIWEIALHAAYWKYVVRRRLRGERRGSFPLKGSNWFVRPPGAVPEGKAWRDDLALLERMHRELRDAVTWALAQPSGNPPYLMIYGVAFHDVYHAGQIRLLRRLME